MMHFEVSPNNNFSVTQLLKACSSVNAKVIVHNMQRQKHYITAEPQGPADYDELISLIERFYEINSIEIDTIEIQKKEREYSFNFEDEKLNQQFTILADAVTECSNNNIAANGYILSAIQNIHAKLQLTPTIDFSVNDIVDANYGTNMPYETSGGHIWNLVVSKNEHQAFVVPLFRNASETQQEFSTVCIPVDETMVSFFNMKTDLSSTFLAISIGKWISNQRISKVIGKATSDCLQKVITALPKAFDFSSSKEETSSNNIECVEILERENALK